MGLVRFVHSQFFAPIMILPLPIAAITADCCSLACYSYLTLLAQRYTSQENLIRKYDGYFAEWKTKSGLMTRGTLFDLLYLEGFPFTKSLFTNQWEDVVRMRRELGKDSFKTGFVFSKKPTNHTALIALVSKVEVGGNDLVLMWPDRPTARMQAAKAAQVSQETACDFLVFFA